MVSDKETMNIAIIRGSSGGLALREALAVANTNLPIVVATMLEIQRMEEREAVENAMFEAEGIVMDDEEYLLKRYCTLDAMATLTLTSLIDLDPVIEGDFIDMPKKKKRKRMNSLERRSQWGGK